MAPEGNNLVLLKQKFDDSVQELMGMPERTYAWELFAKKQGAGTATSIDAIGRQPDDEQFPRWEGLAPTDGVLGDRDSLRKFFQLAGGSQTFAEFLKTQTPYDEIRRSRSWMKPIPLDLGHAFDDDDPLEEMLSVRGQVPNLFATEFNKFRDKLVIERGLAHTQTRGLDVTDLEDVEFPEEQIVTYPVVSTAPTMGLEVISAVREKMDINTIGKRVFMFISPRAKKQLVDIDGNKINNFDFVDRKTFESGAMPDIYGVHVIPHYLVPDGQAFACVDNAIYGGIWQELQTYMAQDPSHKFHTRLYMKARLSAARVDDVGVVQVLTAAEQDLRYGSE